jgi:hypothetical protein
MDYVAGGCCGLIFTLLLLAIAGVWLVLSVRLWLRLGLIERSLRQFEDRPDLRALGSDAAPAPSDLRDTIPRSRRGGLSA